MRAFLRTIPALTLGVLAVAANGGAANQHVSTAAVCPTRANGVAHCNALVRADPQGSPWVGADPTGLTPATVKSVYRFPTATTAGAGSTIGIVDAYDHPAIESDLDVFDARFGLPPCTTSNGCFRRVDAAGGSDYPHKNADWALEIAMDVEWAHAIAPGARILLVEADSDKFDDLVAAEDYARTHAQYVSNSWGGSEFAGETASDVHFAQPGVSIFFSTGDSGLPAQYPAASPNVIAVGGTTLQFTGATFTGETGWAGGGGGCSLYETATPAQAGFGQYGQAGCAGKRATPDMSLVADPATGVSVYDSYKYKGQSGWFVVGGTSASTPMAAAHAATTGRVVDAAALYGPTLAFRDITEGDNGAPPGRIRSLHRPRQLARLADRFRGRSARPRRAPALSEPSAAKDPLANWGASRAGAAPVSTIGGCSPDWSLERGSPLTAAPGGKEVGLRPRVSRGRGGTE